MNIPTVDVVIPVLNEAADLGQSVRHLRAHLQRAVPGPGW